MPAEYREFNINDTVRVKLTQYGKSVLRTKWIDSQIMQGSGFEAYSPKREDENGWSKWQLWEIMGCLGVYMSPGFPSVIETTIELEVREQR